MRFEVLNHLRDIEKLKDEWDHLKIESVFQAFEWIYGWYKHVCTDVPYLVVARKDGNISGIAALVKKKILGKHILRFAGAPLSDYNALIIQDDSFVKRLLLYLIKTKKFDAVFLEDISDTSATMIDLSKYRIRNSYVFFSNPCLAINLKSDIRLHKKPIRRQIRLLQSQGELDLLKIDKKDYRKYFSVLHKQHKSIWNEKTGKSIFMEKKNSSFFLAFLDDMKDKVDFWALTLDKRPIALQLGFLYNNRYIAYIQSLDRRYMKNSPGSVLYALFIGYYMKNGLALVDFTRGAEGYKYRFSNEVHENHSFLVSRTYCLYLLLKMIFLAKSFVVKNKKLHVFSIRLRQGLRNAYRRLEASVEEM